MSDDEILELMQLKGWSRQDLADSLELSQNTIARWFVAPVKQRRHPSVEHVEKMRAWLKEVKEEKMRRWLKESREEERQPA